MSETSDFLVGLGYEIYSETPEITGDFLSGEKILETGYFSKVSIWYTFNLIGV